MSNRLLKFLTPSETSNDPCQCLSLGCLRSPTSMRVVVYWCM